MPPTLPSTDQEVAGEPYSSQDPPGVPATRFSSPARLLVEGAGARKPCLCTGVPRKPFPPQLAGQQGGGTFRHSFHTRQPPRPPSHRAGGGYRGKRKHSAVGPPESPAGGTIETGTRSERQSRKYGLERDSKARWRQPRGNGVGTRQARRKSRKETKKMQERQLSLPSWYKKRRKTEIVYQAPSAR